jgi:hypothetical protein
VFFVVDDENGGVHEGRGAGGVRVKMGQTDTEATACWGTDWGEHMGGCGWRVSGLCGGLCGS